MSTVKNNNIFEKTSFLGGNSSEFIEELYADYLSRPHSLPSEWQEFFRGLNDGKEDVLKTVSGPSWAPEKKKKRYLFNGDKTTVQPINTSESLANLSTVSQSAKDSIRASVLMRAYRIRGHLLSNLDPLGLQKPEEHPELRPETYGFRKGDENKKIFLDGIFGMQVSTLKEVIKLAKILQLQD